jgi:hypothetical protein
MMLSIPGRQQYSGPRRGRFEFTLPNLGELANLYSPIRHVSDDLELSAHRFNDFAQGADVHVRAER